MFSQAFQYVRDQLFEYHKADKGNVSYGLLVLVFLSTTWLSWYTWRFSICPALNPREPKQMPYWIPVIGHAVSFFRDSEALFTKSREYFHNTRQPFALTVAGQQLYIVTSPPDVSAVYRNNTTLTFDQFVRDIMLSIGASEDAIRKMWEVPGDVQNVGAGDKTQSRLHKALAHAGEDFYRQQLQPGDQLDELWPRIQNLIDESLLWDNITGDGIISKDNDTKKVSLLKWSGAVLLSSVTRAIFGETLLQLEPDLLNYFTIFDDNTWKLTYKLPRPFAKDMFSARDKIVTTFEQYFALPEKVRADATWLVHTLEREMRHVQLQQKDMAALFAMPFWVINSNAYKLCFWIMAYLVYNDELYAAVKAEADHAVSKGSVGLEARIESCPHLVAVYNEALRLNTSSASVRAVAKPTDLRDVTLNPGATVLAPYRQLHFDETVFGESADTFDADRFLLNNDLAKSPSFRPFGGGTTYCAGRHVAKREVLTFVALVIHRYTIALVAEDSGLPKGTFPRADVKKPTLGVLPPLQGADVYVEVSRKMRSA